MFTKEIIWDQYLKPFVSMLLILLVGHLVIVYLLKLMRKAMNKPKFDPSLVKFLSKALNIALHIIVLLSALSAIGVSTTGLVAALSAAVVGVAVALKDSLNNIAGGILLLLSPRFLTGDYISVSGDEGTVLSVDLLHTTVRTKDGRQVSIPNGTLINSHITNFSREEKRRVDLKFQIPYDADAEKAKKIALDVISSHPLVLNEPEVPLSRILEYSDSSVNLITRVWCLTPDYWTVYFDLTEQVRTEFEKNGIEIPFNQLDVHIKER